MTDRDLGHLALSKFRTCFHRKPISNRGGEDPEEQRSAFPAGPGRLRNTLQTEHSILKVAESTRCPVQNKKHSTLPEVSLLLKTHLPSNSVQRTQAQVFKIQGSNEAEVEITHLFCISC